MTRRCLSTPPPAMRRPGPPLEGPVRVGWGRALRATAESTGLTPTTLLVALIGVVSRRYECDWVVEADEVAWVPSAWDPGTVLAACVRDGQARRSGVDDERVVVRVGPAPDSPGTALVCVLAEDAVTFTPIDRTFDFEAVRALVSHVGVALAALSSDPTSAVGSIAVLTAEEQGFLEEAQGHVRDYPGRTLHWMFLDSAAARPDAAALIYDGVPTTYSELRARAGRVACDLRVAGVEPRTVVGLAGERSVELFAGLLGILMAGCAVCYLDPALPAPYLAAMAKQCGLDTMVVPSTAEGGRVPVTVERMVEVGADPGIAPSPWDGVVPDGGVGPDDPAYVIFTSGTTGRPRGVVRPHGMHTSRIALEQSMYAFGPSDRHLLKSPISFREFLWPLASGGTAVIARSGGEKDDRYLLDLIQRESVNVVSFVPSTLRFLVENPSFSRLISLRHAFVGGEALDLDLENRLRSTGVEVHNTYTLTEVDYVSHRPGPVAGSICTIGKPLDMTLRLLDRDGQRVPPGCWGEIHAGGPGLATGYLQDRDTAARFVVIDGVRMFRTGDLARFCPNKQLQYGGRRDLQVKVRGLRVEPSGVEDVLRRLPGVRHAAVVGYPDPAQGARLVAFVQPREDSASCTGGGIRKQLADLLPDHFVPSIVVVVPHFPLLLSGKIDRSALKVSSRSLVLGGAPPINAVEARLVELWSTALGFASLGTDVTFAEAGGDSLRMLVLRAAMESEYDVTVALAELVGRATIQEQAELVVALTGASRCAARTDADTDDGGLAAREQRRAIGREAARKASRSARGKLRP